MKNILIIDSTLRDGNHAVQHQLNTHQIATYSKAADNANVPIIIVGHGNGIGASSLQVGESLLSDQEMLETARKNIVKAKLGVFDLPGFSTIRKNLSKAIEIGIDVVCVSSHCTEADITQRHVEYVRQKNKIVYSNLLMTHMIDKHTLVSECLKLEKYGSQGVILMDSAGAYFPKDVSSKISTLVSELNIPVGFHAHNNLGLATANSLAAVEAGATIIDSCSKGFGAGAGNAQIEVIVAILNKIGYKTGIDLYKILDASEVAENELMGKIPNITSISIVSGLAGVFSGFSRHVERISKQYNVDPRDVFFELGRRKPVAGQEDLIVEVAINIAENKLKKTE